MKKTMLLHAEISYVIAGMGHQDVIVIGDSGLPTPPHVQKIDLALRAGVPGFLETLEAVLSELQVEKAWVAGELLLGSVPLYEQITGLLNDVPVEQLTHDALKQLMVDRAVAVIRTGENTPYANIVLQSGVTF